MKTNNKTMTENENQGVSPSIVFLAIVLSFAFCYSTVALLISLNYAIENEAYTIWVVISGMSALAFLIAYLICISKIPLEQ